MSFNVGDTVINSKTNKIYTVQSVDEAPYLTLLPLGEDKMPASPEEAISMHEDFVQFIDLDDEPIDIEEEMKKGNNPAGNATADNDEGDDEE